MDNHFTFLDHKYDEFIEEIYQSLRSLLIDEHSLIGKMFFWSGSRTLSGLDKTMQIVQQMAVLPLNLCKTCNIVFLEIAVEIEWA